MEQSNGNSKRSLDSAQAQPQNVEPSESCEAQKRKLYAIEEREESSPVTVGEPELGEAEAAYDADVDELEQPVGCAPPANATSCVREVIYELFQPWALKTYGDQAKTKTITLRKKARILKALEGKEHSRPDSSKFRFWVKTKGKIAMSSAASNSTKLLFYSQALPPNDPMALRRRPAVDGACSHCPTRRCFPIILAPSICLPLPPAKTLVVASTARSPAWRSSLTSSTTCTWSWAGAVACTRDRSAPIAL